MGEDTNSGSLITAPELSAPTTAALSPPQAGRGSRKTGLPKTSAAKPVTALPVPAVKSSDDVAGDGGDDVTDYQTPVPPVQPWAQHQVDPALAAEPATQTFPIIAEPADITTPSPFQEIYAMTTPTFDFAAAFKTAFSEAQDKAKAAYEKSTVAMGDANDFAKGNVDAMVESTKILAAGLQELTTEMVAESRDAFEALTEEVKTMSSLKSPADFFKLQSELMRKQMDALMANGTKHSEAFLKLASDAAAPLSNRVSLAVEKVKTVA